MTHEKMVTKMLKNPNVRAEYDRLNREEFAILDEILASRRAAGLSQAQVSFVLYPEVDLNKRSVRANTVILLLYEKSQMKFN